MQTSFLALTKKRTLAYSYMCQMLYRRASEKYAWRTVDTDIVVLVIAIFDRISPEELWIAFGTGSNFHYIPIHKVAAAISVLQTFSSILLCRTN